MTTYIWWMVMHSAAELGFRSLYKGREETGALWMKESISLPWTLRSEHRMTHWATL